MYANLHNKGAIPVQITQTKRNKYIYFTTMTILFVSSVLVTRIIGNPVSAALIGQVVFDFVLILLGFILFHPLYHHAWLNLKSLTWHSFGQWAKRSLLYLVLAFIIQLFVAKFFVGGLVQLTSGYGAPNETIVSSLPGITIIIITRLLTPLVEEVGFRYCLIDLDSPNRWGEILKSALIFSLFHYTSPYNILYAFVVGILFGWIYTKTRRLGDTLMLHFWILLIGLFGLS